MSKSVKLWVFQLDLELCSDNLSSWLCYPGRLYKDCTIWLDGARPLPIIPIMCLTNSLILLCLVYTLQSTSIRQIFNRLWRTLTKNKFQRENEERNKFWPAKLKWKQQLKPAWLSAGLNARMAVSKDQSMFIK